MAWQCPYCLQWSDVVSKSEGLDIANNATGIDSIFVTSTICKNNACKNPTISVSLAGMVPYQTSMGKGSKRGIFKTYRLRPEAGAKFQPGYIPGFIINDYNEACLIADLSPKASATLSRRCLQGMIRNFFGISKDNLFQEIQAIKELVDLDIWMAIDSIRSLGNIGAHMEKDVNIIIDIDPEEAILLIGLIEQLFTDWYVARYERQQRIAAIQTLAAEKKEQKKLTPEQTSK